MLLYYKMKIITDKSIKLSLSKYGFSGHNEQAHRVIDDSLDNFINKSLKKASKQAAKEGAQSVSVKHLQQQRGGAETTLPLEYFGVDSKHYHDNAPQGTNMAVTNSLIRPAFAVNDPMGLIAGGGARTQAQFSVPLTAVKQVCQKQGVAVSGAAQKVLQQKFDSEFSQVLAKVSKKFGSEQLKGADLEQVLKQKKFQKLFKQ